MDECYKDGEMRVGAPRLKQGEGSNLGSGVGVRGEGSRWV